MGGLSVGEPPDVMYDMVARTTPWLPDDRPRYLMGAGTPAGPGRGGGAGRRPLRLRAADAERPERPAVHERGPHQYQERAVCRRRSARRIPTARATRAGPASRAYLRHLFMADEINAATLNTLHNLHFYLDTLSRIRDAIVFGRFESFRLAFHQRLSRQSRRFMMMLRVRGPRVRDGRAAEGGEPVAAVRSVRARCSAIFYFIILLPMKRKQQKVQKFLDEPQGRRPGHHDRRHLRPDRRGSASRACRSRSPTRSGSKWPRRPSAAIRGSRRSSSPPNSAVDSHGQNLRWKIVTASSSCSSSSPRSASTRSLATRYGLPAPAWLMDRRSSSGST